MSEDLIGYAELTQAALRSVVRETLKRSKLRPPGDHHFYLSFRTRARGVEIADFLLSRYPEEMTIVLQHQYDDLTVSDIGFAVTLSFGGVPQRIVVPFAAMTRFYDPSVRFALPFEVSDDIMAPTAEKASPLAAVPDIAENLGDEETPDGPDGGPNDGPNDGSSNGKGSVVSLDAFRRKN